MCANYHKKIEIAYCYLLFRIFNDRFHTILILISLYKNFADPINNKNNIEAASQHDDKNIKRSGHPTSHIQGKQ